MELNETDLVRPSDARPAGRSDECYYCRAAMGSPHNAGCVVVSRSVVVEMTIRAVISVPRDWDREHVEFSLNGSSACADNYLRDLGRWADADHDVCACQAFSGEFVSEATAEDHESLPVLFGAALTPSTTSSPDTTPAKGL